MLRDFEARLRSSRWRVPGQYLLPVAALVGILGIGALLSDYYIQISDVVLYTAIAAVGYNVLFGNAGQFSIGSAAFIAIGAFTATGSALGLGAPFWASVIMGACVSAIVGVAIGIPSLRLQSHYLIFGTLALHFITVYVLTEIQGSQTGWSLPSASIAGFNLGLDPRRWFILYAVLFVSTVTIVHNLIRSRIGRAWSAIREHPSAAACMGINVVNARLGAFALSAFLFGGVGALIGYNEEQVSVANLSLDTAILYAVICLVGGVGSITGSIIGTIVVVAVPYLVTTIVSSSLVGSLGSTLANQQPVISNLVYGIILVVVIVQLRIGVAPGLAKAARGVWARYRVHKGRPTKQITPPILPGLVRELAEATSRGETQGTTPILMVRGLTVRYGHGAPAIRDVAIELFPRDVVTLLGANGAGKTTTLRTIAGFLAGEDVTIESGEIELEGDLLQGQGALYCARRGICFVPERDKVFRTLSVRQNLELRLPSGRTGTDALDEILQSLPALAGILASRDREAGLLSGGERQILALGMALAVKPRVLILDEPCLGLSPRAIAQVEQALDTISNVRGISVLMAEQNARIALGISDYIYVLTAGAVSLSGPAREWSDERLVDAYLGTADVAVNLST